MCGIAGIISFGKPVEQDDLQPMADALQHRGPAQEGFWCSNNGAVGFAHRRLAVLDLSPAASQPLHYLHYTIVYNGEIYNYRELRAELQKHGYSFHSSGDTEIIPAAYDCWGLDFLHKLDGMFAFALYSSRTNLLVLARDRFGEKPLYYTGDPLLWQSRHRHKQSSAGNIVFASEMKALWAAGVERKLNDTMLLNWITSGFVQHPKNKSVTFFNGIHSLPPGHVLQVNVDERKCGLLEWYHPEKKIKIGNYLQADDKTITEKFAALLYESVDRRLRSDVAVGSSLSGGLDSSSIVAITSELLKRKSENNFSSECFTAVFPGFEKDEYLFSKTVADHFNLRQHLVQPTADDLVSHWNKVMYHQEEPVQSSSVFTQFMVYELAKQHGITVLLDGQGADEILGGYKKYSHWFLQQLLRNDPAAFLREKKLLRQNNLLERWGIKNYAAAFAPAFTAKRLAVKAKQQALAHPFLHGAYYDAFADESSYEKPVADSLDSLLFYNTFQFGLEELLHYADRNSMAHSREVRLPFLYHELVEFVFTLSPGHKIRNGFTKWVLRKSMEASLPAGIVWRKDKIGYEPPQQQWMQHETMREMIMESRNCLVEKQILKPAVMDEAILFNSAHAANNSDWRYLNAATLIREGL